MSLAFLLSISSKQTGNWTDVNTWLSGFLPSVNDNVTINAGQTITIPNGEAASAGVLNDKGILRNFGKLNIGRANSTDLYVENFKYKIRGGLQGINLDANNDLTNTLFSLKLAYEEGTNGYFDGNIRNQYWKSNIDGIQRAYEYSYDGASRITGATYAGKTGESYALENMAYDFNGNITNLWRKGMTQNNTFDYIDKLSYTYGTNSNKINSVTDAVSGNLDTGDFRDGNKSGNDYEYWLDGSLKKDLNKGIDSIKYNYLKLPQRIKFSNGKWINYQYDANGKKLRKTTSENKITDYLGNLIYENNALYQIGHDEGRIVNGIYEYNITDHLGNLRVAFKDSAGIAKMTQAQDFDPWGLENWTSKYVNTTKDNRFRMNGNELEKETGLTDLGVRMYNPTIGRSNRIDPAGELSDGESSYAHAGNNPQSFIDAGGAFKIDAEFARSYPILTRMLAHYLPQLANNRQVVSYFMNQYNLSEKQVTENFEFGNGPWITPTQDFIFGEDMQDPRFTSHSGLYHPEYKNGIYKNNIFINKDVLALLEQSFKSRNIADLGGRMFETTLIILHEYTHYLNVKTNKNWKAIEERMEQGALFEKKNFKQFSYTKNNGGFGPIKEYYQQNALSSKMTGMSLSSQDYFNNFFLINSQQPKAQKGDPANDNDSKPSALGGAH